MNKEHLILLLVQGAFLLFSPSVTHCFRVWSIGDRLKMIDLARVQKELVECSKDSEGSGIKVSPKNDNLVLLIGTIPGPVGTPYEGGIFQIDITLPGTIISYSPLVSLSINLNCRFFCHPRVFILQFRSIEVLD